MFCATIFCPQGLTVLFHGTPGTGKTLAAEAIGYEVGKPLKVTTKCLSCGHKPGTHQLCMPDSCNHFCARHW